MWFPPEPGDIVWCRFPQRPRDVPGPKPRPSLVLAVSLYEGDFWITVAYGTSKRLDRMVAGEFAIRKLESPTAYALAGLSFDTKFNLQETLEIPWNEQFFVVSPNPRLGQTPKLGSLHPCLMKAVASAARAAKR
jgi:hypothetical protein